jgi:lipoate-protein ligase A
MGDHFKALNLFRDMRDALRGRLLEVDLYDPFANMALEEALFRELKTPTLRVWRNQKSVVIGRAQMADLETDLRYCRAHSIPVVRRFTAGGAVYNGPGNLNWSFFIPRGAESGSMRTGDPKGVFESFAAIVVSSLKRCGADCRFRPPNSIADEVGKVSGMAAYISRDAVLCHGTLLMDADLEEVRRLTTPSPETVPSRYPRSRVARVSNCAVEGARFISELAHSSGYVWERGGLTGGESRLASELVSSKYTKREWNLGDPFALDDL